MSVPEPMADGIRLGLLSWQEVAALDRERTVAILPVAAVEQHGPHLPLDTDTFLCTQVVEAAATQAQAGGPVLVAPTHAYGSSAHHMAFAGTLTLTAATFLASVGELCRSLIAHGFRRLIVVNGHGGNSALAREAVQQLAIDERVLAAAVDYWALAREAAAEVRDSPPGGMAHACELETSLMLYLRPESVRSELVRREIPDPRFEPERLDLLWPGPVATGWRTHELSSSGVLGAPDLATGEKGKRLFEACVEGLSRVIEELRAAPLPERSRAGDVDSQLMP
jgi:creatinine amidohydrolase